MDGKRTMKDSVALLLKCFRAKIRKNCVLVRIVILFWEVLGIYLLTIYMAKNKVRLMMTIVIMIMVIV